MLDKGINEEQILVVELDNEKNDKFKDRGTEINVRPLSFSEYLMYYTNDMGILVISLEDFLLNKDSLNL